MKMTKEDNEAQEIIPGLFIGSVGKFVEVKIVGIALNKPQLLKFNIKHIVNACGFGQPFTDSFKYKYFNILDSMDENIS